MKYPTMGNTRTYRVNLPELNGGVNHSLPPHLIGDNQLADVKNMWYKDGRLQTRPGFVNCARDTGYHEYTHVRKIGDTLLAYSFDDYQLAFSIVGRDATLNGPYFVNGTVRSFVPIAVNSDGSENLSKYRFLLMCFYEDNDVVVYGVSKTSTAMETIEPHVPVIMKGGAPAKNAQVAASGTSFEPRNLLTPWFECQYTTDGENGYFILPEKDVENDIVYVEYDTPEGATVTHVLNTLARHNGIGDVLEESRANEEDGFRIQLGLKSGAFWFRDKDDIGVTPPLAKHANNVRIRAKKRIADHLKTVCGMSFSTWYGGGSSGLSGGSRLFLSGNADHPNLLIWSSLNNPLYLPATNYAHVGDMQKKITAFGKQDDLLVIFKERELYCSQYLQGGTPTLEDLKSQDAIDVESAQAMFPMTPVHPEIGCDCPDTICLCENRLVWLNSDGRVYGLFNYSQYNEKNVRVLSKSIERRLLLHSLKFQTASAAENGDYYFLLIDGNVFVMDLSSHGFSYYSSYSSDERAQNAVAWYEWDIKRQTLYLESAEFIPQLLTIDRRVYLIAKGMSMYGDTVFVMRMEECTEDEETEAYGERKKAVPCYFRTKQFDFGYPERYKRINPFYLQITGEEGKNLELTYLNGNRGYVDDCSPVMAGEELENCTPMRITPNAVRVRDFGFRVASEGRMEVGSLTLNYATMGTVR